jgi:hypothetical protein
MILCSCCERRIGHSIQPCDCLPDCCHRCQTCDRHCQCGEGKKWADVPVVVPARLVGEQSMKSTE